MVIFVFGVSVRSSVSQSVSLDLFSALSAVSSLSFPSSSLCHLFLSL